MKRKLLSIVTEQLPFEDDELDFEEPEDSKFSEDEDELLDLALRHLETFLAEHEYRDPEWASADDSEFGESSED